MYIYFYIFVYGYIYIISISKIYCVVIYMCLNNLIFVSGFRNPHISRQPEIITAAPILSNEVPFEVGQGKIATRPASKPTYTETSTFRRRTERRIPKRPFPNLRSNLRNRRRNLKTKRRQSVETIYLTRGEVESLETHPDFKPNPKPPNRYNPYHTSVAKEKGPYHILPKRTSSYDPYDTSLPKEKMSFGEFPDVVEVVKKDSPEFMRSKNYESPDYGIHASPEFVPKVFPYSRSKPNSKNRYEILGSPEFTGGRTPSLELGNISKNRNYVGGGRFKSHTDDVSYIPHSKKYHVYGTYSAKSRETPKYKYKPSYKINHRDRFTHNKGNKHFPKHKSYHIKPTNKHNRYNDPTVPPRHSKGRTYKNPTSYVSGKVHRVTNHPSKPSPFEPHSTDWKPGNQYSKTKVPHSGEGAFWHRDLKRNYAYDDRNSRRPFKDVTKSRRKPPVYHNNHKYSNLDFVDDSNRYLKNHRMEGYRDSRSRESKELSVRPKDRPSSYNRYETVVSILHNIFRVFKVSPVIVE